MHLDLFLQMESAEGRVGKGMPLNTAETALLPSTDFIQFVVFHSNHRDGIFRENNQSIVTTWMPLEMLKT